MASFVDEALSRLSERGVSRAVHDRIGALLRSESDVPLAKMVPPRLARDWQLPDDEVLEAFLQATRLGLFDLEWSLRCPSCTGPTQQQPQLDGIRSHSACPFCEIDFVGSFDQAVEVTWKVNPVVRDVSDVPALAVLAHHLQPEPVLSWSVEPGALAQGDALLEPGNYHAVVPQQSAVNGLRVEPGPAADSPLRLVWDGQRIDRGPWSVPAGRYCVEVCNQSAEPVTLHLSAVARAPWVSAAELACCQTFRDLFSSELIRPEDDFAIRSLDFVFTDLKGSTALYERVGDSRAFALVRDHFEIMTKLVHEHRGAIVKTIGDAVMATFRSPAAALRFSLAVHQAFDRFNREQDRPGAVIVKVGIHRGPCIAVNLNDRIDYFGRTVNTAARVQGQSQGGDVVVSESFAASSEVQAVLAAAGWRQRPFTSSLKGIEGEAGLVRLTPPAPGLPRPG